MSITNFNDYVLKAVDYLYRKYRLLGYGSAVLTHDIEYGSHGTILSTGGGRTMSVAAVMEVILTAIQIYAQETGYQAVWDYLPKQSWENFGPDDIKAHLWVNPSLGSYGTADALRNFKMGGNLPFQELLPGSFINFHRKNGTAHAVVFLNHVDAAGKASATWDKSMVGFRYFSSQGGVEIGRGGLDFRVALFGTASTGTVRLSTRYKKDTGVIYSTDQQVFNTGMLWHPQHWGQITL